MAVLINFHTNNITPRKDKTTAVFALRKQGKIVEAFEEVKKLLPNDYPKTKLSITDESTKWLAIALKCVVFDLIKIEIDKNSQDKNLISYLIYLLDGIDTQYDESSRKAIELIKRKINVNYIYIKQEKEIPHEGDQQQAISLLKTYIKNTQDFSVALSLGWRISFQIKHLLSNKLLNCLEIKKYLKEYFCLKLQPQQNENNRKLHRFILIIAKKFYSLIQKENTKTIGEKKFNFSNFIVSWDLSNLTDDDWNKDPKSNFNSLAVDTIQKAAKNALSEKQPFCKTLEYLCPYIEKAIMKESNNIWLHLYLSRILQKLGKTDDSICHMVTVIKNKTDAWWAWSELGEIYSSKNNNELSESCFCKALLINKESESYKLNTHKRLAEILYKKHDYSHSKTEYEKYFSSASKISNDLERLRSAEWYLNTVACQDMLEFYEKQSNRANEVLYEDIPWIDAILGPEISFKIENKIKRKRIIYISPIRKNLLDTAEKIEVSCSEYNFSSLKEGSYLQIKGEFKDEKFHMYLLKKVNNNSNILKSVFAYIYDTNQAKNIFFAVIKEKCTIKDSIEKLKQIKAEKNSVIKVCVCSEYNKKTKQNKMKVVNILGKGDITDLFPNAIKEDSGTINVISDNNYTYDDNYDDDNDVYENIKFGFVNSIFIPANLIIKKNIHDKDLVTIKAVSTFDAKKHSWGYKAIDLEKNVNGKK